MDQLDAWSAQGRLATAMTNVRATLTALAADGEELLTAMAGAEALTPADRPGPSPRPPRPTPAEVLSADLSDSEFAQRFVELADDRIAALTAELARHGELRRRLLEFQVRQEAADGHGA